jgi:hypothetical protein
MLADAIRDYTPTLANRLNDPTSGAGLAVDAVGGLADMLIGQPYRSMNNLLSRPYVSGDPQAAEDAFNVAGAAMTGGLLAPRPRNSLGTFGGVKAKTADHDALARAQQMEAQGVDRDAVWRETGWGRGVDGKWRFEIDDSGAQLDLKGAIADGWQPNQKWPLDHVLTHKGLDAAYPDINARGIFYRDFPREFDDAAAATTKTDGAIALNRRYRDFDDENKMRPLVLHEGQHIVQRGEGFARGGSPIGFTADQIAAERARLMAIPEDPDSWTVSTVPGDMSDRMVGQSLYNRLAGEAEARVVQKRLDMTPEERRARPFWYDYDVPENQQIVNFYANGGRPGALAGLLSGYGYQQQQPNQLAADWTRNLRPGDI